MEKETKEQILKLTTRVQNADSDAERAYMVYSIAMKRLLDIAATIGPDQEQEMELVKFALGSPDLTILSERLTELTSMPDTNEESRLLIDMDGTLAKFQQVDTLETLYEEGYFLNLTPLQNVIDAVKEIIRAHPEKEVYIMSSVLSDSQFALKEKNAWLDKYLPEIDTAHRIFPPCGENKLSYVPGGVKKTDYLLDDYTYNLMLWEPPAKGIKLLNGINHTQGTWKGSALRYDKAPEELAKNILDVMDGAVIQDMRPQQNMKQEIKLPKEKSPKM